MPLATAAAPLSKTESTNLLGQIGNTPLLRLDKLTRGLPGIEIYGKAEYFNPGGSVKDRAALNMILEGERSGQLTRDKIILDATSGNTGLAYAMIAAAKGYRVRLCLPRNASHERKQMLKAYGAETILTDPAEGSDGAIRKCRDVYAADPESYFYPDQYNNPANWRAHYETTGPEIVAQTQGRITHFVACMGTSGTFMGVSRRLRQEVPGIRVISAQPSSGFHGLEGLKHMPTAIVPGIYDPDLADDNLWIETEDAYAMTRKLGREEGILVGISSGANLVGAMSVARRLVERGESGVIVTVLCDGAGKYLSEPFWNDPD
ncbi:MAG TPA: cysteine synthase family protein [Verrucomicrobiae bacterium]|nr:cysteine synthase family protein [Bryobacteraceae bacterium]HXU19064.1 cysteine synthase family protein [Verrucomicrobiae bacterium]